MFFVSLSVQHSVSARLALNMETLKGRYKFRIILHRSV